jgi:hypothetical protein
MTYRATPADEVIAKLPAHVREAGEARGRELLAELQRQAAAEAERSAAQSVSRLQRSGSSEHPKR